MPVSTLGISLALLIVLAAFFSAAEIGMMSINRYRLRYLVKKNHKQAKRVSKLLKHPDKLLGIVLIGSTLANILASMVSTLLGQYLYGELGVAVGTVLLTIVILVFAEMAPKTLAALYSEKVAFACAWPLTVLRFLMSPFVYLIGLLANLVLRLFGISLDNSQKETLSREELRTVMLEAGGRLHTEHQGMLISLLDLEVACVEDIMVPQNEIVGLDISQPWQKVIESLETVQHTRLPVYDGSLDNLLGVVHLRRILNVMLEEDVLDKALLMKAIEPPYFVLETTPLNAQILNFQKMKRRSGFVVDEYGNLQGLVTMEDILEEVVGEFTTNIAALNHEISAEEDGSYIIDAKVTLRELNRALAWQLPSLGPRTLSGLIIEYLGYIPPSECCLRIDNYQIEVLKVSGNRIKSVRMFPLPVRRQPEHHDSATPD